MACAQGVLDFFQPGARQSCQCGASRACQMLDCTTTQRARTFRHSVLLCAWGRHPAEMVIALYKTCELCSLAVSIFRMKWKRVGADVIMPNRATRRAHHGSLRLEQKTQQALETFNPYTDLRY